MKGPEVIQPISPLDSVLLPDAYGITTVAEIERIVADSQLAYEHYRTVPLEDRSRLLKSIAAGLRSSASEIVSLCHRETGLPIEARLNGELERTASVLDIFSEEVRSGRVTAQKHSPADESAPVRAPDVKRVQVGIGPIVVIEASNFPLAFGVVGGDSASALAAGCSVIAKVHELHPGVSELIGKIVGDSLKEVGLPQETFQLVFGGAEQVEELATNPLVRGVGFTGSRNVGKILRSLDASRSRPLDQLSLEMGSVNPVFLFPHALEARGADIATGLLAAINIGAGQFCTNPGNVFVPEGEDSTAFLEALKSSVLSGEATPQTMLSAGIQEQYFSGTQRFLAVDGVELLAAAPDVGNEAATLAQPMVLVTDYETFSKNPHLREEIFGPVSLVIVTPESKFEEAAASYEGELTGTLHVEEDDTVQASGVFRALEARVGRVLFNGYPPGVRLCEAMNHSGPWPAAFGQSTVVGPDSYIRWTRPVAYQDAPEQFLTSFIQE